jgi:Fur family zinc uptake transcriptional regulator
MHEDTAPARRSAAQNEALVLRILQDVAAPNSAYKIAVRTKALGSPLAPAQVYRSLKRLIRQGQVVRIETCNGYSVSLPGTDLHLFCTHCSAVTSLPCPALAHSLHQLAAAAGFDMSRAILETRGACARCRGVA